jgi:type II secretory pathway pseudopilin PulG
MLLFLFLATGVVASLLLSAWSGSKLKREQELRSQQIMQDAKAALIAWSAAHRTTPGRLPCPEEASLIGGLDEGKAQISCSDSTTLIGRIPWRTLGLVKPADASGEQLWYVLSPGFRGTPPVGSAGIASGQLQLDGPSSGIAALVIAPGAPLPGQTRPQPSPTSPPNSANYLDLGNAAGPAFVSNGPASSFNDQVIAITTRELFLAMRHRVLAEIQGAFGVENGLRRYYNDNGSFPPTGTPLNSLNFDTATRKWLSPSTNPDLWFSQVDYISLPPPSWPRLTLDGISLEVTPCTTTPCP